MNFRGGPQLQFLFHSENNNNGWGYKFSVVAHGLPDISVSWVSDLLLLTARLLGRLASRTMALKSPQGEHSAGSWSEWRKVACALVHDNRSEAKMCEGLPCRLAETGSAKDLPAGKMNHILASALWKPMFKQGLGEQHTRGGSEVTWL